MRIAIISTPFVAVPPPRYGGTELIVAELVQGLTAAGHEVTLFATGDSHVPCEVRAIYREPAWPPDPTLELDHAAWAAAEIAADARRFDVVHAHVPPALSFARFLEVPMVYTIHHDRCEKRSRLYSRVDAQFVAISARQRELCPEAAGAVVVHHGVSPARYSFGRGDGGYAAFLGRFAEEKGVHVAIDVARAARVPLRLAGVPHWRDAEYFACEVSPRLCLPGVEHIGELGGPPKVRFLGEACALLFPVCWEEPFGLVMIEAMLCGTPVLALPRGSVPEIIEEGVTGFICSDEDALARRLRQIVDVGFDRRRCRARALERWSARRMVDDYLAVYESVRRWDNADARTAAPAL